MLKNEAIAEAAVVFFLKDPIRPSAKNLSTCRMYSLYSVLSGGQA